ncbi:MAG: LytTR family DNA-binding domain-containing protein [Ignavibacteriales bacterium]|nr:LytTR family DNA-binding domain-containing protein [Ignavibacteriales bacterium]
MNEVSAIIIDDEDLARMVIREHLAAYPHIRIVAECCNGFDAVKQIAKHEPDLLFLDIQMPKLNGFEILELITHRCEIIFVTAYDQFALKAFDVHAVDYLLKPFSKKRFDEAMAHALAIISSGKPESVEKLRESLRNDGPLTRILIRVGEKVHVLPVDSVSSVEAQDDYVEIHAEGKKYLKQQRLSELESLLDPQRFIRVHRSIIVNIDCIARIELYAKDSRLAVLRDGRKLPISRTGYEKLKGRL